MATGAGGAPCAPQALLGVGAAALPAPHVATHPCPLGLLLKDSCVQPTLRRPWRGSSRGAGPCQRRGLCLVGSEQTQPSACRSRLCRAIQLSFHTIS